MDWLQLWALLRVIFEFVLPGFALFIVALVLIVANVQNNKRNNHE